MLKQHALECLPIGDSACSSSLLQPPAARSAAPLSSHAGHGAAGGCGDRHLLLPEQLLAFLATLPELRTSHGLGVAEMARECPRVPPRLPELRTRHSPAAARALSTPV